MTKSRQDKSNKTFNIPSADYWFKVVGMLQQNWALITWNDCRQHTVHFISDTSGVFDCLTFMTQIDAEEALARNGFRRYIEDSHVQTYIQPPLPPFQERPHRNGLIYSSGQFWE